MDIKKRIDEIFEELVEIRRDFHMHPELSESEHRTSEKICEYLDAWGIEYQKGIAKTGVVGIIRGKTPGRCVAARADIDALPVQEATNCIFKSVNDGVMHACGHDIHTTVLLGVAKILKELENELKGNVKLIFQPAEETVGGAERMIKENCMKNPDVEYITGVHVMPYLNAGFVELKYGKLNAATNSVKINVKGKTGHGAYPDTAIDAIVVSSYIITALQSFISRNISPLNSVVLSLGKINGGTKGNIICGEVEMIGTLRTLDPKTRQFAKERITQIVENTAKAHGAEATVSLEDGYSALICDDDVMDVVVDTAKRILGEDKIYMKEFPSMGAEDFSYFCEVAKGAFYSIGCGVKEGNNNAPLHSEFFEADEECIKTGVLMQTEVLLNLLNK